ncbi:MAG: 2-oxoglutarate dehydrogenase E1 component [Alphaproteobacteria bacterium]|nr:2-oxoglutarate dehydrogenase E1 component [Alphaproteobacteria bacterium]MBP9776523.1 2-oxoglutarate dehydrogenase E1 component [Alphaproteobacteria bacterium]
MDTRTPKASATWSDESLSFLTGDNACYIAQTYASYLADPNSVSFEWRQYFASLGDQEADILKDFLGPSWGAPSYSQDKTAPSPHLAGEEVSPEAVKGAILDSIRAIMLIRAYRARGHMIANLDPLNLIKKEYYAELDPQTYGFKEEDYDRPIFIYDVLGLPYATLHEIIDRLRKTYCGTVGIEFLHVQDPEKKLWLQKRIEGEGELGLAEPIHDIQWKKRILKGLTNAEAFEKFLHVKYPAAKRFGLDGGESLIPGLEEMLVTSSRAGVEEVVLGMTHRGRLNVLANIMEKPYSAIFSEFQGQNSQPDQVQGSGDVKYHLGGSTDRYFEGRKMHLSLTANPSHLEAVDPVVTGKVRAKQTQYVDQEKSKVIGLLLHGDASFVGQGLVAETFMLSQLHGYQTGGTFHVIINNQIGFTTPPAFARSTAHCSDLAMIVQAPIFHVNGDDPEAVVKVMRVAAEFRYTFKSDVVVDLICYRRFGHNEIDEPAFTQPLMYKAIRAHPSTRSLYIQKLIEEGSFTQVEVDTLDRAIEKNLQENFKESLSYKPLKADWLAGRWQGFSPKTSTEQKANTGVKEETLVAIGVALSKIPKGFHLHPKLERFLSARRQMVTENYPIDWSMGEALAFGSLAMEGHVVRLSGQDSGRGTFSQRHAVLRDQETEKKYVSLNHLSENQAYFEVWDSPLAEVSVLGFELGYSLAEPRALVLWEAQFGDFANGAQVIIDQFIAAGESKWLRMSGLVLLLPHGYEGQGPEHSSARLERYLQLCGEDNMQVVNCTTPANYFHVLRRQVHRNYRKPLIVMTPKVLLRHKLAVSTLQEFNTSSHFQEILPDSLTPSSGFRRVILCSGKVYYDLLEKREEEKIKDIAIIRLEQLYPFPHKKLVQTLRPYQQANIIWCQEEPMNMGAWTFLDRRLEDVLVEANIKSKRPIYVGRPEAASPATGLISRHILEQNLVVNQALDLIK